MKQNFDKIEAFRVGMNTLIWFYCHVKDHYDREGAEQRLHELMAAWHKSEEDVVRITVKEALDTVNARSRALVGQLADKLGFPTEWEDFKVYWDTLGKDERHGLIKQAVALHSEATA